MPAYDLLEPLSDGEFHSGQALAIRFGVSRTAIWKQIRNLSALGVDIEKVRGLGYRIADGLDLLQASDICDALQPEVKRLLHEIKVHRTIDSTNAELQRQGLTGTGASVCLAETQTAGRGRRGRPWVSPFGSSIYMTVGWRFDGGAEVLEGLPLAVGVLLCETLGELGVGGLALKWPNDVLLDGRKLAGILVEVNGDLAGPCNALIGIGINVALPPTAAESIEQPWADLRSAVSGSLLRNRIVAVLLSRLLPALSSYGHEGFSAWQERWRALDAYAGQPVLIDTSGRRMAGTARGVDERGSLLLETASGTQRVFGGEVSLRPQP
jgi:BirA family biotin operon repressor/biotin-[acetyl-CoA-carboxylase] ligase